MTDGETVKFWRARHARACNKRFQGRQLLPITLGQSIPRDRPQPLHNIDRIPIFTEDGTAPKDDILVGIIGAGPAGLYAAMILDDLKIHYEILEGSSRPGGRIRTHYFDPRPQSSSKEPCWNYFDVGAMRFPKIPIMWRVFDLFENRLGIKDTLIPYIMSSPNQVLHYNNIGVRQVDIKPDQALTDSWNDSTDKGGLVPEDYVDKGVNHWLEQCFGRFKEALKKDWDQGWEKLMQYDKYSARMFMATKFEENDFPGKKDAYPDSVINWMERMNTGTGLFDMAFSEMVIDDLEFNFPTGSFLKYGAEAPEGWGNHWASSKRVLYTLPSIYGDGIPGDKEVKWYCLKGGSAVFIDKMVSKTSTPILYGKRVTSISAPPIAPPNETVPAGERPLYVTYTEQVGPTKVTKSYDYVISTIPLPALRYVDLEGCDLSYAQLEGLRTLRYNSSCKVGIRFVTRWWQDLKSPDGIDRGIKGGQSMTDRVIRTAVFPSYGIEDTNADAVMIASYTWSQDALRVGGLCNGRQHVDEKFLIESILRDLAVIHSVSFEFLSEQCVDWYAFDWNKDPFALGPFAHFGPGQFSNIYPAMRQVAAGGRLIFAGEALSDQHAWVEGALNSAYEAVYKMLVGAGLEAELRRLEERWGNPCMLEEDVEEEKKLLKKEVIIGATLCSNPEEFEKRIEKYQLLK
ncbi:hypothetical protein V5O48_014498 [Marasmius crinis-equi]|uniref:Amine oxidase domain-containing protein n=1 Tax=Marasmius crinis-equi TaxID=585013 RepID=A0ABR3EX35_9AGAR